MAGARAAGTGRHRWRGSGACGGTGGPRAGRICGPEEGLAVPCWALRAMRLRLAVAPQAAPAETGSPPQAPGLRPHAPGLRPHRRGLPGGRVAPAGGPDSRSHGCFGPAAGAGRPRFGRFDGRVAPVRCRADASAAVVDLPEGPGGRQAGARRGQQAGAPEEAAGLRGRGRAS